MCPKLITILFLFKGSFIVIFFFFFLFMNLPLPLPHLAVTIPRSVAGYYHSQFFPRIVFAWESALLEEKSRFEKRASITLLVNAASITLMEAVVQRTINGVMANFADTLLRPLFSLWPDKEVTKLVGSMVAQQPIWWPNLTKVIIVDKLPTGLERTVLDWFSSCATELATAFCHQLASYWDVEPATCAGLAELSQARAELTLHRPLTLSDALSQPLSELATAYGMVLAASKGLATTAVDAKLWAEATTILYKQLAVLLDGPIRRFNLTSPVPLASLLGAPKTRDGALSVLRELLEDANGAPPVAAIPFGAPVPVPGPASAVLPAAAPAPALPPAGPRVINYKALPRDPATGKCWRATPNPRYGFLPCSGDHDLWSCPTYVCPVCRVKSAGHAPPSCPQAKGKEREFRFSPQGKK